MSKIEKLIARFKSNPKDFTWNEIVNLLTGLGYEQDNAGRTSGSRCRFICDGRLPVTLHKPHPAKILKPYVIKQIKEQLEQENLI